MQRTASEAFPVPTASDVVLAEIIGRLVEAYRPLRICLFGSAALGDAGPDSDYDLRVVAPDDSPADSLKSRNLWRLISWGDLPAAADEAVKTG